MSLVLYQMKASPPCRAVIIVAKLTGLVLELKVVNVLTKDQMKPEFLKMNQAHTIPTLVDDTFVLVGKPGHHALPGGHCTRPNHPLYPKDIKKRALIDQLLDFDIGTLYKDISTYFYSYLLKGQPKDSQKEEAMKASLRTFESILGDKSQRYLVGKEKSLADILHHGQPLRSRGGEVRHVSVPEGQGLVRVDSTGAVRRQPSKPRRDRRVQGGAGNVVNTSDPRNQAASPSRLLHVVVVVVVVVVSARGPPEPVPSRHNSSYAPSLGRGWGVTHCIEIYSNKNANLSY
uniref:Putative glutathione s-transferase delta 2 mori glutathione s-transferase delta n=1 Tax=Ixodes ricinus TaxID=34613 RepID=V5H717_IXORI